MNGIGPISLTLLVPFVGALLVLMIPPQFTKAIRWMSILFSGVGFLVSLTLLQTFNGDTFHFQMVEAFPLIPEVGIWYKVGIDGVSIWLFLLTTLLSFLSVVFSQYVKERVKEYFALILLLEASMLGVFVAMDMILFYTFFEFSLIPMAFLIYIWGGKERAAASIKFFVYTFAASIFLLVGMIVLARHTSMVTGNPLTFDFTAIQSAVASGQLWEGFGNLQTTLFVLFTGAFIVKCPMFPVHTWLPDAHTEAPTAGSIILAGVLLKMGTYGFLRFSMPLFPEATQASVPFFMILAIIGITYGAVVAAIQPDVKKLVAYSSVAHMGFVVYGIFSLNHTGMMGGAYQQLSHGISTGALFLLIGLIYERTHTRAFKDYGGLKKQMPIFAALFLIVMLSSVGLPPLNGFVGEFYALLGGFQTAQAGYFGLGPWIYIIAGTGVILAAVYLLWMFQKLFYGPLNTKTLSHLKDIKPWEAALVGVFVIFIFWGGMYPNTFLKPMEKSINATRQMVINPPGKRPDWTDQSMEINSAGMLTKKDQVNGNPVLVADSNYYELPQEKPE